jgi:hypothetical protein
LKYTTATRSFADLGNLGSIPGICVTHDNRLSSETQSFRVEIQRDLESLALKGPAIRKLVISLLKLIGHNITITGESNDTSPVTEEIVTKPSPCWELEINLITPPKFPPHIRIMNQTTLNKAKKQWRKYLVMAEKYQKQLQKLHHDITNFKEISSAMETQDDSWFWLHLDTTKPTHQTIIALFFIAIAFIVTTLVAIQGFRMSRNKTPVVHHHYRTPDDIPLVNL